MNQNLSTSNESTDSNVSIKFNRKRKCSFENTNIVFSAIHENYPLTVNQSNDTNKIVQVNSHKAQIININL
jgi:hypothetical protein